MGVATSIPGVAAAAGDAASGESGGAAAAIGSKAMGATGTCWSAPDGCGSGSVAEPVSDVLTTIYRRWILPA